MTLKLTVKGPDTATETRWAGELKRCLSGVEGIKVAMASLDRELGPVVFLGAAGSTEQELEAELQSIDRAGRALFLIVNEDADLPKALSGRKVDDVLVFPFRKLDIMGKLQHYQQILMWDEVNRVNASVTELIERLQDDLRFVERIQKSKLPQRFTEVKNFHAASRYLAGARPGGDHFDLADTRDGNALSLVLSDSSSYGLSSAVLSAMMKVAVKLSEGESRSCYETVRRIQEEIQATLREKDRLSLFYGVISRKDFCLNYLNLGTSCAYYAAPDKGFQALPTQGEPIHSSGASLRGQEARVPLEPKSRLVLVSDGFAEAVGGREAMTGFLDEFREKEAKDALNELVYRVKSAFSEPDDLPKQDCTAVILDADAKVLRLAAS